MTIFQLCESVGMARRTEIPASAVVKILSFCVAVSQEWQEYLSVPVVDIEDFCNMIIAVFYAA